MAIVRPKVRIVQEFASQSTTPASPDLNVLLIGPAYNVQDYTASNKANLQAGTYGDPKAATATTGEPVGLPLSGSPAVTISSPPNDIIGAILDSSSVHIYLENIKVHISAVSTTPGVSLTDNSTTVTASGATFVTDGVKAGDRVVITDTAGGITIEKVVASVTSETVLELTSNFTVSGTDINGNPYTGFSTTATNIALRIERSLSDGLELGSSYITVTGQQVDIDGGAQVTEGTLTATLHSADVYMEYRSLRQDLAKVTLINSSAEITSTLGAVDERNPLAVAAFVALQNTNTPVQVWGILKDDLNGGSDRLLGYTEARDGIASRDDIYCIVPLATESSVIGLFKDHVVALADPDISRFRIAIGSGELATTKTVSPQATGATEEYASDPIDIFIDTAHTDTGSGFITAGVKAGDTLTIVGGAVLGAGTYTVRRVISEDILQIDQVFGAAGADTLTSYTIGSVVSEASTPAVTSRKALRVLLDNGATFLTSGVIAGDYVEVPAAGQVDFSGATDTYVIEQVLSENRVLIAGTEGELPSTTAGAPSASELYRIGRSLDKDGQVAELEAITQAYNQSRLVMVWPDKVLVSGVTNAKTGVQSQLPGYYMAAAVGGMVAGNAPHQNFSSLSINGFDQIFNSSGYFSDSQIDKLSAAGWYVILQDTPASAPYCVHSVTTDPTSLETSELMIVKNFDYVSLFYKGLLKPFLKGYNVTEDTLDLIKDAFDSGTTELKSQVRPKLGAPLISGSLVSIEVLAGSADHVQLVGEVQLPRMLNLLTLILSA